jgi:hypothetical protein
MRRNRDCRDCRVLQQPMVDSAAEEMALHPNQSYKAAASSLTRGMYGLRLGDPLIRATLLHTRHNHFDHPSQRTLSQYTV